MLVTLFHTLQTLHRVDRAGGRTAPAPWFGVVNLVPASHMVNTMVSASFTFKCLMSGDGHEGVPIARSNSAGPKMGRGRPNGSSTLGPRESG
jgi:hypothetical protein